MKNSSKIIIYDDTCPFCASYTRLFVKARLIKKENRKSFSDISDELLVRIDLQKCPNEIPVIDTTTNQVWYGIDGLLEILQQKIPFIKAVANINFIKWFLLKLYKLISYNRRVIVAPKNKPGKFDCTPDFNKKYRLAFLFVFLMANTLMLFPIYTHILRNSIIKTSIYQLQAAHFALIAINIIIAIKLKMTDGLEYLGQANMLALITVLLMLPLWWLNKYFIQNSYNLNSVYIVVVTLFILKEYGRRIHYADLYKNHQWIVYINAIGLLLFFTYLIF